MTQILTVLGILNAELIIVLISSLRLLIAVLQPHQLLRLHQLLHHSLDLKSVWIDIFFFFYEMHYTYFVHHDIVLLLLSVGTLSYWISKVPVFEKKKCYMPEFLRFQTMLIFGSI